jgi:hypothetical protein
MTTLYRLADAAYRVASRAREWAWTRLTHVERAEVVRARRGME